MATSAAATAQATADTVKAVPILARTAGLLAHLAEERDQPLGFLLAAGAESAVTYEARADDTAQ